MNLDLATIVQGLYVAAAAILAILVYITKLAYAAGGDLREIKLATVNHGPRIEKLEVRTTDISERVVVLETRATS
jgi:hypothetical protein